MRAIETGRLFALYARMSHPWRTAALCLVAAIELSCTAASYDKIDVPFDPDSPAVYVAKVKNILVGLPPTDAEVAAVIADPTAMTGLVTTWMALPQYQQKMMVFFELAFQQTQVSAIDFAEQTFPRPATLSGSVGPLLVENATESFARTVLELNTEGRPLTDAVTTQRFLMTPALMEF